MAGKYGSLTPYNYAFNDPVYWNDPGGADPGDFWKMYDKYGFEGAQNYEAYGSPYGITTDLHKADGHRTHLCSPLTINLSLN
jgi:hypothetical protein